MKFFIFTLFIIILAYSFSANYEYKQSTNAVDGKVKRYDQVTDFTIPPWKMYPKLRHKSLGWRMGYGEFYIHRWHKYFRALDSKQRLNYKTVNPEPMSWEGFYSASEDGYTKINNNLST